VPDVWSTINTSDEALLERLAITLEPRAADPQQQQMLRSYLSEIAFPDNARVLEIGCGTGAVTQTLATWPGVGQVTGIDPSPAFIDRARTLRGDIANLSFQTGDGRALTFADESFDVVVFHTILTHAPEPQELLGEAFRVLRPNGTQNQTKAHRCSCCQSPIQGPTSCSHNRCYRLFRKQGLYIRPELRLMGIADRVADILMKPEDFLKSGK
jgi:ubiquinone/menaquinone biosynthesis C-methylase UbiE